MFSLDTCTMEQRAAVCLHLQTYLSSLNKQDGLGSEENHPT